VRYDNLHEGGEETMVTMVWHDTHDNDARDCLIVCLQQQTAIGWSLRVLV